MLCLLCTIFFVAYLLRVAQAHLWGSRHTDLMLLMHPWQRAESRGESQRWSLVTVFISSLTICHSEDILSKCEEFQIPTQKHTTHPCTFARFLACISLMICAFTNTGFPGATFSPSRYRTVVENFDCVFITCGGCLSTIRELKGLQS